MVMHGGISGGIPVGFSRWIQEEISEPFNVGIFNGIPRGIPQQIYVEWTHFQKYGKVSEETTGRMYYRAFGSISKEIPEANYKGTPGGISEIFLNELPEEFLKQFLMEF